MAISRRQLLATGAAAIAATSAPHASLLAEDRAVTAQPAAPSTAAPRWKYSLNMSTIRGQKLPLDKQVEVAAAVGYDGIEPWIGEIEAFVKDGGSLMDLSKKINDSGLVVIDAIGFAPWIANDDATRAKGLEQAKRDMELVQKLGCTRIAAPPAGETNNPELNLLRAAERYRVLCDLGQQFGITPLVEVWGFSKSISRLGEAIMVASESGHPAASVLPDIYHLYKGGSDFAGLHLLSPEGFPIFHVNDYPAGLSRGKIEDKHRVYPGDGVAPLGEIFAALKKIGFSGYLSLELFNPEYWKQDAALVAKTGLEKTKAAVG